MSTLAVDFRTTGIVSRIWQRDVSVFLPADAPDAARASVSQRLGWLDAPTAMTSHLPAVEALAAGAQDDGLDEIYLLGMGGSSLCAEVLRDTAPPGALRARLVVLDTTDEAAIRQVTATMNPSRACFIVASKSGSTIEVTSLERHFWTVLSRAHGATAGRHFVAITDPGTSLVTLATERGYRQTFVNPPDIGGRFSALSLFGLVPAALVGLQAARLIEAGRRMAEACRAESPENPGWALGVFMANAALSNRDKLTIVLPDSMASLGAWIEQLVAESTGKNGRGVLPVVGQSLEPADRYGADRAFAVTSGAGPSVEIPHLDELERGHPVFRLARGENVGAEFFRWEFATAVAGATLGVNPFDEPNVRAAKDRTSQQLDERRRLGRFRVEPALEPGIGFSWRAHRARQTTGVGRYIAILDYLPSDGPSRTAAADFVRAVRSGRVTAVTHGIGPRYLHSTGQYHKGGPNSGCFLLLTADDATETAVPGADYSFSALKQAQALGDFEALVAAGRDVLHYHLPDAAGGLAAARTHILERLEA